MDLKPSEKLMLMMLCDIHKHLDIKGGIDPNFVSEAIATGNTWGLDWKYSAQAIAAEDTAEEVVNEVVDILDMWAIIESSHARLSARDKALVEKEVAGAQGKTPRFPGFDANRESDHRGVVRFLVGPLERFESFAGRRDLNSHMPMLDWYRQMLSVFLPMRSSLAEGAMNAHQMVELLNTRLVRKQG